MASSPFLRGGNLRNSLGTTLNGLLERVSPAERRAIRDAVAADGLARGVVYEDDDGRPQPTPILLRPRILGGNQRAYLHKVSRVLESAHQRLFHLWHELSAVRALLPLTEREERWLFDLCRPGVTDDVFFGRFDASSDFGSRDWVKSTQFFEYNPIGAGGTFMAPAVDAVILAHLVPALRSHAPTLLLEPNDDPRTVLLEVLADYARSLRLKRFNVAMCQYKDLPGGVNEFPHNVEFLRAQGIACWHVDPLELRRKGDELWYEDHPIDLIYRDHEVNDFAAKEEAGHDLSAMRFALHSGRCVSSLAGEFDHKSAFQVFTSPQFASYFTGEQRRVFARHVPWTRIVADERSTDPEGREVDLLWWLQRNKDECVLKPNRSYGGEGILLGRETEPAAWDAALQQALESPRAWVVQGYRPVAELDFPVIGDDGEMQEAEYFSVLGLFPSFQRLGILGRASRRKVVNVAQKGGIVAVLRLL